MLERLGQDRGSRMQASRETDSLCDEWEVVVSKEIEREKERERKSVYGCVSERKRERERKGEREKKREREKESERASERERDKEIERATGGRGSCARAQFFRALSGETGRQAVLARGVYGSNTKVKKDLQHSGDVVTAIPALSKRGAFHKRRKDTRSVIGRKILVLFFFVHSVSSKRTLLGGLVSRAHLLLLQFDVICLVAKRHFFVNGTTVNQVKEEDVQEVFLRCT
jgi:hypothetical protein